MRRCIALLFLALAWNVRAEDGCDYWVWHRTRPLRADEQAALAAQNCRTLFWHIGEMQHRDGTWQWQAPPRARTGLAEGLRVVPVVRLVSETRVPFAPAALARLQAELRAVAGENGALQIDFDCPDRLVPEYAAALRALRRDLPQLSITALAHWPRLPSFQELARAAGELVPMFYDLQADPTGVGAEQLPPALLDPAQLAPLLASWRACPVPWRAGLPHFARLTVFDRTGLSRGQIANWEWEDFCFHAALHHVAPTRLGVTLFRAARDTQVAGTAVRRDEFVASRFPDRAAFAQAIVLAREAGAAGIILFRLPDGSDPAGRSLSDLQADAHADLPRLVLERLPDDRLVLRNPSARDWEPRLSGSRHDRDRGYSLEIDAPAAVFREALAGDFWRVVGHAQPDAKKPQPVAVPLATRLTFWFSDLRADAALETGLLQLAPEAAWESLRYRIREAPGGGEWQPFPPQSPTPTLP